MTCLLFGTLSGCTGFYQWQEEWTKSWKSKVDFDISCSDRISNLNVANFASTNENWRRCFSNSSETIVMFTKMCFHGKICDSSQIILMNEIVATRKKSWRTKNWAMLDMRHDRSRQFRGQIIKLGNTFFKIFPFFRNYFIVRNKLGKRERRKIREKIAITQFFNRKSPHISRSIVDKRFSAIRSRIGSITDDTLDLPIKWAGGGMY